MIIKLLVYYQYRSKISPHKDLNKIVAGHLNINSIKNKFDFLAHQVTRNIDILMTSETKFDESFPPGQFLLDGYSVFSVLIGMGMVVVFGYILGRHTIQTLINY